MFAEVGHWLDAVSVCIIVFLICYHIYCKFLKLNKDVGLQFDLV
uniref:GP5a n=1 Tax=Bamboo rat arterivirus TaxID=3038165 RepID=A0AAT9TX66_9NIDO|nr:GP5a [Bamboo rat arterivirus]WFD49967.1 GP5a [Bamboo rat arterivirus]WFD49977.1 GP5a [Bamboo rat arterivirus]